jgi:hypothetical protein
MTFFWTTKSIQEPLPVKVNLHQIGSLGETMAVGITDW